MSFIFDFFSILILNLRKNLLLIRQLIILKNWILFIIRTQILKLNPKLRQIIFISKTKFDIKSD
jgi:hypothetical protein